MPEDKTFLFSKYFEFVKVAYPRMEHLKVASLKYTFPTNIRLGLQGLQGTKILA
jgi:hypothetical protein